MSSFGVLLILFVVSGSITAYRFWAESRRIRKEEEIRRNRWNCK